VLSIRRKPSEDGAVAGGVAGRHHAGVPAAERCLASRQTEQESIIVAIYRGDGQVLDCPVDW